MKKFIDEQIAVGSDSETFRFSENDTMGEDISDVPSLFRS
jgi:hypothetical protein